jgi:hypothetical protein
MIVGKGKNPPPEPLGTFRLLFSHHFHMVFSAFQLRELAGLPDLMNHA